MTLETLISDLKAAGANSNTIKLAMNAYEIGFERGVQYERRILADKAARLPFGDTAASYAVWIRNGGKA